MKLEVIQHLQPLTSQTLHQTIKVIHLTPLYKPYNIGQTSSFKPNYTSQPPTTYNEPYKFDQPSNYTNPIHSYQHYDPLHIATEKKNFRDEINQVHDLSDLLAMHLAQRNKGQPPSSPYANCLPHSLNLDQVTNHTHFCPLLRCARCIARRSRRSWIWFISSRNFCFSVAMWRGS